MTPEDELHQLRTENATLKHQLEHLDQCLAALDAYSDELVDALGGLIREFEDDPDTQARVTDAISRFANDGHDKALLAKAGLPKPLAN